MRGPFSPLKTEVKVGGNGNRVPVGVHLEVNTNEYVKEIRILYKISYDTGLGGSEQSTTAMTGLNGNGSQKNIDLRCPADCALTGTSVKDSTNKGMKQTLITLPKPAVEYKMSQRKLMKPFSEIIKGMVIDHCIEHLEIGYQDGQRRIDGKTFQDYYNEYKYLKEHLPYWPEGSKEHLIITARIKIVKNRLDMLED